MYFIFALNIALSFVDSPTPWLDEIVAALGWFTAGIWYFLYKKAEKGEL